MGTTARLAIMQQMADAMGLRLSGTLSAAQGAGSSSFADTARRHEGDGYLEEGFVLTTGGTGSGQERRISGNAQGTSTVSIYGTWASALDTTSTYDIYRAPVTPDHYRSAIKAARSKVMAKGIGRRVEDTSLVTTGGREYPVPPAIDTMLADVRMQARELIANRDWCQEASGWTLHANATLSNDGDAGERTLKLIAAGAGEESFIADIEVSPLAEMEFFAQVKGVAGGRWRYRFLDSAGAVIVGPTLIGTAGSTAAFAEKSGTLLAPVNAVALRLSFDAAGAGTVYTLAPNLMVRGEWERLRHWRTAYDGSTMKLLFDGAPPAGRRLLLTGRATLEALASDADTVSLDEPEMVAFVELCCAEAWRQFGGMLPNMDGGTVDREVAKHVAEAERYLGPLGQEWRVQRTPRTPMFSAGH